MAYWLRFFGFIGLFACIINPAIGTVGIVLLILSCFNTTLDVREAPKKRRKSCK